MDYDHTQVGYYMIYLILGLIIYFSFIIYISRILLPILIISTFIIFILFSFITFRVTIDRKYLRVKFGYGLFRKKFLLENIASAKAVRNRWYYGWGIRVWFSPYMWIYNIYGLDAVEIVMKDKKIYRIGTDEPKELEKALLVSVKL